MGIIKNIKNLFVDVEEQEIVEEIKEEVKTEEVLQEEDYLKAESKFRFPVVFSDEDLISDNTLDVTIIHKEPFKKEEIVEEPKPSKVEKKIEKVTEVPKIEPTTVLKQQTVEVDKTYVKPKKFKPAPAISPVYGLLKKESMKPDVKMPVSNPISKSIDLDLSFDSVRKKAYGNTEEENIFIKETEELINSFEEDTADDNEILEKIDGVFTELEKHEQKLYEEEKTTLLDIEESYNDSENINNTDMDEVDKYLEASFDTEDKDLNISFFKEEDEVETGVVGLVDEALDKIIDDEFKTTREAKHAKLEEEVNELDENTVEYELFNLIDTMYENRDKKEGEE